MLWYNYIFYYELMENYFTLIFINHRIIMFNNLNTYIMFSLTFQGSKESIQELVMN